MSYFIKLENNEQVEFPTELDSNERVQLCDKIINEYYDDFSFKLKNAPFRLEIMANYILAGSNKDSEYPHITEYKAKKQKNKEITFSDFEYKYDKNSKNE